MTANRGGYRVALTKKIATVGVQYWRRSGCAPRGDDILRLRHGNGAARIADKTRRRLDPGIEPPLEGTAWVGLLNDFELGAAVLCAPVCSVVRLNRLGLAKAFALQTACRDAMLDQVLHARGCAVLAQNHVRIV